MSADTWRDRWACIGRTQTAAKVWTCDEEECHMTYFALMGLYLILSARGTLDISPTWRDSYILVLGFLGKQSSGLLLIPLLHRSRFSSPLCREFDVRVYGSIHGCVDFLLVAHVIFMSFSSYFRWIFVHALFLQFWGVLVQIRWWGSWIDVLCIFVLDLDPPISGFDIRLNDFGWNPSFLVELGCDSIRGDLVHLRSQDLGYSIS
jgi:hypothetical protein